MNNFEQSPVYLQDQEWCKAFNEKMRIYTRNYNQQPNGKYQQYKNNAKKRDLPFLISFEEFNQFWQQPCYYCGSNIPTIGLDRVDNEQGYSIENVRPCCRTCNIMKQRLDTDVFIEHCARIVKNLS